MTNVSELLGLWFKLEALDNAKAPICILDNLSEANVEKSKKKSQIFIKIIEIILNKLELHLSQKKVYNGTSLRNLTESLMDINLKEFISSSVRLCEFSEEDVNSCLWFLDSLKIIKIIEDPLDNVLTIFDIDSLKIKSFIDMISVIKNESKEENEFEERLKKCTGSDLLKIAKKIASEESYFHNYNVQLEKEALKVIKNKSYSQLFERKILGSRSKNHINLFCSEGTAGECKAHKRQLNEEKVLCEKLHFKRITQKHTDEFLGDCSFLNSCFHMHLCKYCHYELDTCNLKKTIPISDFRNKLRSKFRYAKSRNLSSSFYPPQWIKCDVRTFDMSILGKFDVIMADPPWDIHMELPYGTMADDEMKALKIPQLQDHGYIFLWVTGRAMELGRDCLALWGYKRCDELVWVKINQIQRLIRTGRTGHWLNHGKEHCLIGVKGNPRKLSEINDCNVIVSEVRDTSHKPDEIYGLIERLSPGTRKIEIFGRQHNVQPNWLVLGNQLNGVNVVDKTLARKIDNRYPNGF